jgi:Zn-dependent oligopeptidase
MENWVTQNEFLQKNYHDQTKEIIPEELIQKNLDSRHFLSTANQANELFYCHLNFA